MLRVRAGSGKDDSLLKTVLVNDEETPICIDTDAFVGYLVVRNADFNGVTPMMECKVKHDSLSSQIPSNATLLRNPKSKYFEGRNRRYSISVQGRFKKSWSGDEVIFGVDADVPVRLPTGASIGFRIAQWLDPAMEGDIFCNKPYMYSPILSAMNAISIHRLADMETIATQVQPGNKNNSFL